MSNGKICSECGSTPCNDECSSITLTKSEIQIVFEYWKDRDKKLDKTTPSSDDDYAEECADYFLAIYNKIFC